MAHPVGERRWKKFGMLCSQRLLLQLRLFNPGIRLVVISCNGTGKASEIASHISISFPCICCSVFSVFLLMRDEEHELQRLSGPCGCAATAGRGSRWTRTTNSREAVLGGFVDGGAMDFLVMISWFIKMSLPILKHDAINLRWNPVVLHMSKSHCW